MVYFGCRDSHLYALDAKTGEKKWAFSGKGSWVVSSPAVKDGKSLLRHFRHELVVCAGCQDGGGVALGEIQPLVSVFVSGNGGGMLYVGSTQGKLVAVDLAEFKPAWSFETDGMKEHGPAYTKADGTPNEEAIYRSDFYDDMVAGVDRVMSMGRFYRLQWSWVGSVCGKRGRKSVCAEVEVVVEMQIA